MLRRVMQLVLAQVVFACFVSLGLWSQDLLLNNSLDKPAPGVAPGTVVSYTDLSTTCVRCTVKIASGVED
jgi:hypothetical protein